MYRALFLVCGVACAQTVSFLPPVIAVSVGTSDGNTMCPGCIVVADFNGDGKPDIAFDVTSPLPDAGVVLGNGDGTFGLVVMRFPLNQAQGAPFAGDFNGDGKQDLVISASSTWLYTGNGDGTFQTPVAITACSGVAIAADLNRDGKTDLICGTSVLLSNGDSTFRSAGTAGSIPMEIVLLTADFNNDGIPDLLLQEAGFRVDVILGRGDGTFGPESPVVTLTNTLAPGSVFAGDFNGDGRIDLVGYFDKGAFIDVLPGKGDGTFGPEIQTNTRAVATPGFLSAVADFNNDGKLDLIAGNAIFAGNGDGTFRFPVYFGGAPEVCGFVISPLVPFPCRYVHVGAVTADFNGDGLPDIASGDTVNYSVGIATLSSVSILLNDSPGDGFTATGISSATFTSPVGPGSIVSAFGVNLASTTEAATVNPAPTTLGGIRLHVRDRSHTGDSLAPLLYVSPTQINYVLNSSDPYAWVAIEHVGLPYVPKGLSVPITPIAPGFFAAVALTVPPSGPPTVTPITSPIDLSSAPVYLSIYGTGFAQASTTASDCVLGLPLPATYAGPEGQIAGLDQMNVLLPKSLAGTPATSVVCKIATAAGDSGYLGPFSIVIR